MTDLHNPFGREFTDDEWSAICAMWPETRGEGPMIWVPADHLKTYWADVIRREQHALRRRADRLGELLEIIEGLDK